MLVVADIVWIVITVLLLLLFLLLLHAANAQSVGQRADGMMEHASLYIYIRVACGMPL